MNTWEGISEQDRQQIERSAASYACPVDVLRFAWRLGRMAGFDEAVRIMVTTERRVSPSSFGERVACEYVPLCRHRVTAGGADPFRHCCHCGAAVETRAAYWEGDSYDETDCEPEPEFEERG